MRSWRLERERGRKGMSKSETMYSNIEMALEF